MSDTDISRLTKEGFSTPNLTAVLAQCLVCGLITVDATGKITSATAEAAEWLGLKPNALLGRSVSDLPTPLREAIQTAFQTPDFVGRRTVSIDVPGRRPQSIQLTFATVPCPNGPGSFARIIVLNNVTPARSLESVMRLLDRLASIGTLSASMAHELKNAMVAVKTFTDVLLKKNQDAELAGLVGREIKRIDSIVSQLMRFSGPAKPTFSAIHIHGVLEQALALVKHRLEAKQVRLVKSFDAARDVVKGDAYQLEQTFINLFSNALEAMGPKGELHVSTRVLEAALVLSEAALPPVSLIRIDVRDTGIGIPPENLKRLFEPFFTTKANGTGLGLAITRRIVEEHRGKITVESALNEGTVFHVTLPLFDRPSPRIGSHHPV